jgi:hypothetical protein
MAPCGLAASGWSIQDQRWGTAGASIAWLLGIVSPPVGIRQGVSVALVLAIKLATALRAALLFALLHILLHAISPRKFNLATASGRLDYPHCPALLLDSCWSTIPLGCAPFLFPGLLSCHSHFSNQIPSSSLHTLVHSLSLVIQSIPLPPLSLCCLPPSLSSSPCYHPSRCSSDRPPDSCSVVVFVIDAHGVCFQMRRYCGVL